MSRGEYRVVADGGLYWVQHLERVGGKVVGGSYGPTGKTEEEFLRAWTEFNQALHKPVVDIKGEDVGPPLVGPKNKFWHKEG